MDYDALKAAMEEYGEAVVLELIRQLQDADKVASKNLISNISYELLEAVDKISIGIKAPQYLEYVDQGRRKGIPPPYKPIMKWAQVKKLERFRDKKGKFISNKARAIIIAKAIGRDGIKPTNVIKKTLAKMRSLRAKLLTNAAKEDMKKLTQGIFLIKGD